MDLKSRYERYERSKRISHIADENDSKRMGIEIGESYTSFPIPDSISSAWEHLKEYKALIFLESLIKNFKSKFPINNRTLEDELKLLNNFIDEAEKINTSEAFQIQPKDFSKLEYYEYLKFKYDYYKNDNLPYYDFHSFFSSTALTVYSKYFLFKEWLENEIYKINLNYSQIIEDLNDAFFRLESFMNGTVSYYSHYDFNEAFSRLFSDTLKPENYTQSNCKRIDLYWKITERIRVDYDKSDFLNLDAYRNADFCNDCEEIMHINWYRIEEFLNFVTPDEFEEKKISISQVEDLLNPSSVKVTEKSLMVNEVNNLHTDLLDEINPYPRIFLDINGYNIFQRLFKEFGNSTENLANYSFVFHKMAYDGLIHFDLSHRNYVDFLSKLDVNIERIKPLKQIGKIDLRESIYNRLKNDN